LGRLRLPAPALTRPIDDALLLAELLPDGVGKFFKDNSRPEVP
jgi:hypothetical protein